MHRDDDLRLTLEPPRRTTATRLADDAPPVMITVTLSRRHARQLVTLGAVLGGPLLAVGAAAADALCAADRHDEEDRCPRP